MATNFSNWTKLSSQQSLNAHIQDKSNPHQTFTLEPQIYAINVATKPSDYYKTPYGILKFLGIKTNEILGLSGSGGIYSSLIGLHPWYDVSGENSHELAFNNGGIWHRSGTEDIWGSWNRLVESSQLRNYLTLNGGTLNGKLILQTDDWEQLDLKEKGDNNTVARLRLGKVNNYPELHITLSSDDSNENRTFLKLAHNSDANTLPNEALRLEKAFNGVYSGYNIYGEHNVSLLDSRFVRKSGDQTLTGNYTIKNGYPFIRCQQTDITIGAAPSADMWRQPYKLLDSTGTHTFGAIEFGYKTNKENRINLICYPGTTAELNQNGGNVQIAVGFDGNGKWFTYAPTPTDISSNNGFIATTAYVHNKFKTSTSDLTAGSSSLATGQFYFVYE